MLCFLWSLYCSFYSKSSKSIESKNFQNTFLCLDISSCLISIQFLSWLIWCFRTSRCVLVFSHWNRRWSTTLRYTYGASSFPCYVPLLLISISLSIAVHIRNVFCVPCTVCDNMQQCADTAILSGNCSAVWDALSLQYTCTEGSVSVHVHQEVSHTRVFVDVPCACVSLVYPFCLSLQRDTLRKWTGTNYWDRRTWEPSQLNPPRNDGRFFRLKCLAPKGRCARAI